MDEAAAGWPIAEDDLTAIRGAHARRTARLSGNEAMPVQGLLAQIEPEAARPAAARALVPPADAAILAHHIAIIPELARLRSQGDGDPAADLIAAILDEAARVAAGSLAALNAAEQRNEPRLRDGRVRLSADHRDAWDGFAQGGWLSLDLPVAAGGQGLPLVLSVAVQEVFDRSCPAFGMAGVPTRSAAKLIARYGDAAIRAEWLPELLAGTWTATICISEVEAGSDVARLRTTAVRDADGGWRVSGEKQWISFGDHDLSARIGHCVLARTPGARGLSLFLVPDRIDGARNGVIVRRLEEKLGLHLSPTCALGFEDARAVLLGEEGRGLAQMFVMITNMRMAVASMGLGIASGAADVALAYARERRQGGRGERASAIIEHADVQRQLLSIHARVELLRHLLYVAAVHADLRLADGAADSAALAQWLLPILKTLGGDTACSVAGDAIQVMGGAGYTADWPVEQSLRDARVLPIFEGTTGMQALDLLHRRLWRDRAAGLDAFLALARADVDAVTDPAAAEARETIATLARTADWLRAREGDPLEAEAGATAFLDLAGQAALAWVAARLLAATDDGPVAERLHALARFWLAGSAARAAAAAGEAMLGSARLTAIAALR